MGCDVDGETNPKATKLEQIRDVAMKCFAEHGIAGTSLRMITETADGNAAPWR